MYLSFALTPLLSYNGTDRGVVFMKKTSFFYSVCILAIPVALQSMLQASFGVVDQIMIGQLGSVDVTAVGLAGKFTGIFNVMVSAVSAVAGIMISQYMGQKNRAEVKRSLTVNLILALGVAFIFTVLCAVLPKEIMNLYTEDEAVVDAAGGYLFITALGFLAAAGSTILSTMLRCMEKASLPLYAGIVAAAVNTGLNYVLIFGKFGFPECGITGAAVATLISQAVNFILIFIMYIRYGKVTAAEPDEVRGMGKFNYKQYLTMLMPILICEFMWSVGENIYAGIYGHLGTDACAAMTLTNPIQSLTIGALSGFSQAAGIIIGKRLGDGEFDKAYIASKKLILYGAVGSLIFSVIIVFIMPYYVKIYNVDENVRQITVQILTAYALVVPFKVLNMIVGGGILRSGGKTKYIMVIDIIGTWIFGVPLGLLSAFVFCLSIPYVYFILSLEECVRLGISLIVLHRRNWMNTLKT